MEDEPRRKPKTKLVRSGYYTNNPRVGTRFEFVTSGSQYRELIREKISEELFELQAELNKDKVNKDKIRAEAANVLEVVRAAGFLHRIISEKQEKDIISDVVRKANKAGVKYEDIQNYQRIARAELGGFTIGVIRIDYN